MRGYADILMRGDRALSRVVFKLSAGFLVGALVLLATALSLSQYYVGAAVRLSTDGDLRGALEAARTASRWDPFDTDPLEYEAAILQLQGKDEAAAAALRGATARDPNNYEPRLLLGNLQATGLEDLDAAAESYRGVLELNPNASVARSALARVLTRQGKLEEAKQEYERLKEEGNITYLVLYNLGRIEVRTGEAREGLGDIRRARGKAEAAVAGLEGPLKARQEGLVRSMDLAFADALVVAGQYERARRILEDSPSEQAPALINLLESDPAAYREQVINSEIY